MFRSVRLPRACTPLGLSFSFIPRAIPIQRALPRLAECPQSRVKSAQSYFGLPPKPQNDTRACALKIHSYSPERGIFSKRDLLFKSEPGADRRVVFLPEKRVSCPSGDVRNFRRPPVSVLAHAFTRGLFDCSSWTLGQREMSSFPPKKVSPFRESRLKFCFVPCVSHARARPGVSPFPSSPGPYLSNEPSLDSLSARKAELSQRRAILACLQSPKMTHGPAP